MTRDNTSLTCIRLDVFGHRILVERQNKAWRVFHVGAEGKRRLATDMMVPSTTTEAELEQYFFDLCHEWATPRHPDVRRLE